MSGPRITRKVTVEVGKKVTESNVPSSVVQPSSSSSSSSSTRRSVFERLGPGAIERSKSRDTYTPDKCRNWLRDGRCPYGSNCKFLHGPYTDPKPRTKSVRSIVHSGSKDRYDDADEKQQHYHSKSFDCADFDEDDVRETPKLKRRHKSEEELSDSSSIKKATKTKKKHKEDANADDEGKIKRKRKTHRKREVSPKAQPRSDDEEEYDRPKTVGDWQEHADLDFERQLELERRRQDLQRQLALMDQEDAAMSSGETDWKGKDKEEDQRKVPIVHSKLHPEPSPSAPDGEASTQVVKKKKKKKLDSEGKKTKVKKEASPRRKEETKRRIAGETGADENMVRKDEEISKKKKTSSVEFAASSDEDDVSEHPPTERVSRKVSRHADRLQLSESHSSQSSARPDERKRHEEEQIMQKREEPKPAKDRQRVEMSSDDQSHVDEGRPRRVRGASQDYYPSTDEQDDEGRKVRSRVTGVRRPNESKRIDEGMANDRVRRRESDYRGPCTPSPPLHPKDDRYYYDELQENSKKRRLPRGPPQSTPREPTRDESIQRKESRSRSDDPHMRGPRTPSDDEGRFSPPPHQVDSSRGSRYAERDRGPPRRELRDKGPVGDQDDQRYSDRGGRTNIDPEYERRKPRDEDMRARRPLDHGRNRDDDYPKNRGRGDNYARDNREDDFQRHRSEREEMKDDRGKYRDERPEDVRPRAREDVDFSRGRGRDEHYDEGRGRPVQREIHRRLHEDPEGHERDVRDERDRPRADYDGRGRYGGPGDADHFHRPSPSQGPPRGRSPPHRYEDRRRPDEAFRSGPQARDPPSRGRAVGRGRNSYAPQYDSRGKIVDNRRSPPPPGPRATFQDRDRGPPRGRDVPMGRGRGYLDKGRPPNERYRDPNAQWERRGERDYTPRDPVARDRRARESPPPPHPPAYRDERTWEENERREAPLQSGHFPAQERRDPPYDADRDSKGRMGNRERRSMDRGPSQWEYDDHANQTKPVRKRTRPIAGKSESPFEAKKGREQSPISPDEVTDVDNAPADAVQPDTPKKPAVVAKDVKKVKKKKKEGKVAKVTAVEGLIEGTATDAMPIKAEKKGKKEKKLKEKGTKKKKKAALTAAAQVAPLMGAADVQSVADSEPTPTDKLVQPKIGKKRKQVIAQDGDAALKEPEKPKKKKKKKHQPEVLVQPWNDLEGQEDQEEDQEEEAPKVEEKPLQEIISTEKSQDDVFSDWSDDSHVGDDSWLDQNTQELTNENKDEPAKDSPVLDVKGPSFDDVYDPISDDEFDAMYTHSDDEELAKEEKETTKALGVEDVDWSSLGISHDVNKEKEPVSHLERFKPSYVFSRIGISPALAGQRLTQLVLEATAEPSDGESKKVEELCIPEEGPKSIGAFVAAAAAKSRGRKELLGNLGPCRRALCARRDLAIRKQLGKSAKFGKLSLFAASPTAPGDNELFEMSVALYKKESANKDSVRIIPSKVGSILLSQA